MEEPEPDEAEAEEQEEPAAGAPEPGAEGAPVKKKTRRGSRGGRKRKKKPVEAGAAAAGPAEATEAPEEAEEAEEPEEVHEAEPEPVAEEAAETPRTVTIHLPGDELGRDPAEDGGRAGRRHRAAEEADAPRLPRRQEAAQAGRGACRERGRGRRLGRRSTAATRSQLSKKSRPRRRRPGRGCRRRRRPSGATCPCPSGATSSTRPAAEADFATLRRLAGPVAGVPVPMSYAIIKVGGKQYRVREGERLLVDRLPEGEGKTFSPHVLLVGGNGTTDLAPTTTVTARVVGHVLGEKIRIGKYKKRTGYRLHNGYRSRLTQIEIEAIGAGAKKAAAKKEAPKPEAAPPRPRRAGARCEGRSAGRAPGASAEGLRGADRRGDRRGGARLAAAEPRGCAGVRAGAREPEGRDRRARVCAGREGGEH